MNEMKDAAKTSLQKQEPKKLAAIAQLKGLLNSKQYKDRFEELMGQRASQFITSIINLAQSNSKFNDVDPSSIIGSCLIAASMDLPINPQLGQAHVIPYGDKATFQMGWRGFKTLAIRTGLYEYINSTAVKEGEFISRNRLTGEVVFNFLDDEEERAKRKTVGYVSYLKLSTGYKSTLYMTVGELLQHAKKYSKLYQYDLAKNKKESKWSVESELPFMCLKTVTKLNISNNGIMSVEMQKAKIHDQAVINENLEVVSYPDGTNGEIQPTSFTEIKELTPDEWEQPIQVIAKVESFTDFNELNEWTNKHADKLTSFGGKDAESIDGAIKAKIKELTK